MKTLWEENNIFLLYSCDNFSITKYLKWEFNGCENAKEIKRIYEFVKKYNIWYFFRDGDYHFKFENIISKPFLVYFKGNIDILNLKLISIVGPRRPTDYAKRILYKLFDVLKNYDNIAVVSGLAPWIDSLAHMLSIKNNIPTIAVLGGGFYYYFKYKKDFLIKILNSWWLVLSEFKIFQTPTNYTFPQRNRIIAGLCDILFVPEAWEKSWSLITVDFAIKMNKSIYWCPNNIFEANSKGINKYISLWKIKAIYDINDFVYEILWKPKEKLKDSFVLSRLDEKEQKVINLISKGINSISKLQVELKLDFWNVLSILTQLEVKWVVKQTRPWFYELIL